MKAPLRFGISALLLLVLMSAGTSAELLLRDTWVMAPVTPQERSIAAFGVIANAGADAETIVAASSDLAESVQIHRITLEDGVVRMSPVREVTIPAGEEVLLSKDGLHLMLMAPHESLWEASHIPIQLHLENGRTYVHSFELRTGSGASASSHSHH